MMIKKIKQNPLLMQCIVSECCENEVSASLSQNIPSDRYVILDIDEFYKKIKQQNRKFKLPPSVDCLILIKCCDGKYKLYIIELKTISPDYNINRSNMFKKFKTTINDFLSHRFPSTFSFTNDLKEFELFLVTNLDHCCDDGTFNKRLRDNELNFLNTLKPFKYNGLIRKIKAGLPNTEIQYC